VDPAVNPLATLSSAPPPEIGRRDAEAARQFEAYLLGMILRDMRKMVLPGGLFSDRAHQGYFSIAFDALAERAAQANKLGLARQLLAEWERRS
jgi:Rod binding domain-containing protein